MTETIDNTPSPETHMRLVYDEPVAWYMNIWSDAEDDVKSRVSWGHPSVEEIERAEHNGHDIEYLYDRPAARDLENDRLRKALGKIVDMLDAEDADLDDAISIAVIAMSFTARNEVHP